MSDENPVLYRTVSPVATSFFKGDYNVGAVVHALYYLNQPASAAAWCDALVSTSVDHDVRDSMQREMQILAKIFVESYFKSAEDSPAWCARGFEIFAHRMLMASCRAGSRAVRLALDFVGAFKDVIVVPAATPLTAAMVCMEAVKESCVYFADTDAEQLSPEAFTLAEEMALRVYLDEIAFDHMCSSEPIRIFFQRAAYQNPQRNSVSRALTRKVARRNRELMQRTKEATSVGWTGFKRSRETPGMDWESIRSSFKVGQIVKARHSRSGIRSRKRVCV